MLQEHAYDEIQMRDVALASGVALGTLYRYFPSKEQLFANVLLEWSSSFDDVIRRRRPEKGTDAQRLWLTLRAAVGAFERHPNFFQLITVLEVSDDPEVVAPFAEYNRRFMSALTDSLTDTAEEDVEIVTFMAAALLGSLLRGWWLGRHSIRSVSTRAEAAVELLFNGAHQI